MNLPAVIVEAALAAKTATDATNVQKMLSNAVGATHKRPLGDKWNNHGLMSTSGSFDLKLIENVTNMQDAVIERHALLKYGTAAAVPTSPRRSLLPTSSRSAPLPNARVWSPSPSRSPTSPPGRPSG